MRKIRFLLSILILLALFLPSRVVRADVAPPEAPPGTTLLPGEAVTQVRMVAETVTLTISADPADAESAIAKTEAIFTMRNLGAAEEKMAVRFPLSFFNGNSDGFGNFPEIKQIVVKINGQSVSTRREIQPFFNSEMSYHERDELPWAVFDATFPPNQDVTIEVVYDVYGYGYYPYEAFNYILETGAGWNGTIGSAEIIVRLPYEVSGQNLDLASQAGYGGTSPNGVLSGNEIRWSFKDFEPTYEDNVQIVAVTPSLWKKILGEKSNVEKNPNDGEAWGRLAKAYKEVILMSKGWLRNDDAGRELFSLSKDAYERCLALLPDDPLWHYGYADLLWAHYYFDIYSSSQTDTQGSLPAALKSLQTALALNPNLQEAKDLLNFISYQVPGAVQKNDDGSFIMLGLTATPLAPTPFGGLPTETPLSTPAAVSTPQTLFTTPTVSLAPAQPSSSGKSNPLCGSAAILPLLFGLIWMTKRKI
ncbi:MAG: hypothetical protein OZ914_06415 [Anaerolineaceae bacterium]|nr:hypothetical protein [Anaerolineaceae bacterium]